MSTIKQKVVESFEDEFSCAVCLDIFDDPVIIGKCTHTFCRDCARHIVSPTGRSITCPLCREIYKLEKTGADGLKSNIYIKNIIAKMIEKGVLTAPIPSAQRVRPTENNLKRSNKGFGSNITSNSFNQGIFDTPGSNIFD